LPTKPAWGRGDKRGEGTCTPVGQEKEEGLLPLVDIVKENWERGV